MERKNQSGKDIGKRSTLRERVSRFTIIIPIIIYEIFSIFTSYSANSKQIIHLGLGELPVTSLTGVFSYLGSMTLIITVLLFRKHGFIVAMVLELLSFPAYIIALVRGHNLVTIPGAFSAISTLITLIIIHLSQKRLENGNKRMRTLFEQTATALVNAIDTKDKYTHGHSRRVAEYSRKLAEANNLNEEACDEVFYAALLHDVGKIGVPASIINKTGKLTDDEYETIKQHPVLGNQILRGINEFPYLSIGANCHHERYDGNGYPYGLKGTDIPEIARIISVADAYDAMSSKRSYRDVIPQQLIREEIVKGTGTQFDPIYARHMLHLIDTDPEYEMRERETIRELGGNDELVVKEYRSAISEGILIKQSMMSIHMTVKNTGKNGTGYASLLLFDSLDGRAHDNEKEIKNLNYYEYGELRLDGQTNTVGARKIKTEAVKNTMNDIAKSSEYRIEAVKIKDHALVRIIGKDESFENIIALPDSTRYMYMAFTGEQCIISDLTIQRAQDVLPVDYIPRIADEISYIDGPSGDIPNVQIDGYRTSSSEGFEIKEGLKVAFHTKSLPTSRLVWHCPFIEIFYADDGKVKGENYNELALIRLDGEVWDCNTGIEVNHNVFPQKEFGGWDIWKERNRNGYDAEIAFNVKDNTVTVETENAGMTVKVLIKLNENDKPLYGAITGDQVAITDIRIITP